MDVEICVEFLCRYWWVRRVWWDGMLCSVFVGGRGDVLSCVVESGVEVCGL